ncbi:response regulator transcription factor [Desulfoscipio geothermicus]|uniref:Stage 0 sporulation protein A homolog n=1 Tax=Desulfoscipio geothermicus DSM 3669 TaxID=1121426 RepID=A0A1I6EKD4_9FIRM|nr:response regulator transcription factor [Desulfoscipio geothermicus]SFR18219.1 DNA-binding response regulator, OmpR family, contains REC and winged-helix (wHTH) domain [Desulfoscipio geothermicus DSM 3669]
MRLLVVEDEKDLATTLAKELKREGYAVDLAMDGKEALSLAVINDYDLVVLDLNLPEIDGLDVLSRLRANHPLAKILILTARIEVEDRVQGLDMGAHDYLTKPFYLKELKARVRALLRRDFVTQDTVLRCGHLIMDTAKHIVWCNNRPLNLTRKEFAILRYMLLRTGKVVSQEELLEHIWDESVNPFTNVVRVHINTLRRKLGDNAENPTYIETVPGVGYRLKEPIFTCNSDYKETGDTQ